MSPLLRVALALLALGVGAAVGAITTFAHAEIAPWMLLGGLAIVAAFVLGARLALADPVATAAAVVGVVGAALVLALVPGDEIVVVADDPAGWGWLLASPVVALAAALWPLPRRTGEASESS